MKILHLAECAGGVERYLSMLLPLLEQRNMKQYFICSQNYDKNKYEKMIDDIFIRAANLIKKRIPQAAFIIVGNEDMTDEIVKYAEEHHLLLYVTGWTDEPYTYLKTFDVALLLSRWEGFGLAVVEYMAAEKNVVASRTDALPTLIDDGIDGLLVEVDSPEDACEKVVWLYEHPNEARQMRKAALKKVYEKYSIQRVAQQHLDMFEELMSKG